MTEPPVPVPTENPDGRPTGTETGKPPMSEPAETPDSNPPPSEVKAPPTLKCMESPNGKPTEAKTSELSADIPNELSYTKAEEIRINRQLLATNVRQFHTGLFFNFVVALSTVALTIFNWRLWVSTDLMRKSSVDQIRPYVFPKSIFRIGSNQEAFVTVKNVGLTPAYGVAVGGEAFIVPITVTKRATGPHFKFSLGPTIDTSCQLRANDDTYVDIFNLASNEERTKSIAQSPDPDAPKLSASSNDYAFSAPEIEGFLSGKTAYVVTGVVCYKDLHSRQYFTRFCKLFTYNVDMLVGGSSATLSFPETLKKIEEDGVDCPKFNDAD